MTRDELIESCFGKPLPPPDLSVTFEINEFVMAAVGIFWRVVKVDGREVRVAGIGSVCTHPFWRNQGFASTLIQAAHELALRHKCTVAALWSSNPALYEKLGYINSSVPNLMWCPLVDTAAGGDTLAGDLLEAEADW